MIFVVSALLVAVSTFTVLLVTTVIMCPIPNPHVHIHSALLMPPWFELP